jgi:hypothetical protein
MSTPQLAYIGHRTRHFGFDAGTPDAPQFFELSARNVLAAPWTRQLPDWDVIELHAHRFVRLSAAEQPAAEGVRDV